MPRFERDERGDELRREELLRIIQHSLTELSLPELEALYYDMITKDYVR
jgi:hypothetical protein